MSQKETIKFVILTKQRSGSTWFTDLLNQYPDARVFAEIFNHQPLSYRNAERAKGIVPPTLYYDFKKARRGIRPLVTFQYLNLVESWIGEAHKIGFKLMYDQLMPETLLYLITRQYKFIHLVRENHLDVVLSSKHIENTGVDHLVEKYDQVERQRIFLEPSSLLDQLDLYEKRINKFRKILKLSPLPVLEIKYENLCQNLKQEMGLVEDFLLLESKSIWEDNFKKIFKGSWREKISNHQEIEQFLRQTKFEKLLNM